MKIKTGDKVKILAGKDRGKTGKVMQVFVKDQRLVVDGLNLLIKHQRPQRQGEKGQRIQFPAPLNISNVALICPKCGHATRVGYKVVATEVNKESGKKVRNVKSRICRKCQEAI